MEGYFFCLCGPILPNSDAEELSQSRVYFVSCIQAIHVFQNVPGSCACCAMSISYIISDIYLFFLGGGEEWLLYYLFSLLNNNLLIEVTFDFFALRYMDDWVFIVDKNNIQSIITVRNLSVIQNTMLILSLHFENALSFVHRQAN